MKPRGAWLESPEKKEESYQAKICPFYPIVPHLAICARGCKYAYCRLCPVNYCLTSIPVCNFHGSTVAPLPVVLLVPVIEADPTRGLLPVWGGRTKGSKAELFIPKDMMYGSVKHTSINIARTSWYV